MLYTVFRWRLDSRRAHKSPERYLLLVNDNIGSIILHFRLILYFLPDSSFTKVWNKSKLEVQNTKLYSFLHSTTIKYRDGQK